MQSLKLKDDFYWTGIVDDQLRVFDIIMYTEFGTTYNSYVLKTEDKTILFETAKAGFFDEYLEKLKEITDIESVDYLVVDHTEPDHAGSVERLLDINPNIKIVGTGCAINFLKNIVNRDFYSLAVKDNETLTIGGKTLKFLVVPNLHWPDTMYTWIEEDKVLITCDSFGSHYGFHGILRSKVTEEADYWKATKYYFDCIIGPFKPYMMKALKRVRELNPEMICTGHGPVLDEKIAEMLDKYEDWCTVINPNKNKTVIIPYVSAYGYTRELAEKIGQGIKDSGPVDVRAYDMVEADQGKVLEELGFADGILFGTPTIVGEALKPIWDLTTSIFAGTHGGKYASAFGSYGWSGEGVPHIIERLKQLKMKVPDQGLKIKFKPGEVDLIDAYEYGYDFGCLVQEKENPRKKKGARKLVKCLVCGEIFDSSLDTCPVCGVGRENFVEVDVEDVTFREDTQDFFVILGNGIAGLSAATAIRERNKTASIVMISEEDWDTYNRPMLTKSMMAGLSPEQIGVHEKGWYEEQNIIRILGKKVEAIEKDNKIVILAGDMKLQYTKLIYALGAECFIPPIKGCDKEEVVAIRKISDIQKINELLPKVEDVVVIGGGVLGLEAAWEFKKSRCKVTVLEAAPWLMGRQLDQPASDLLVSIGEKEGITVRTGVSIEEIEGGNQVTGVRIQGGKVFPAQLVIISAGIRANTALAKEAGLETDRAVVVDENMKTSVSDIYACGDCAQWDGINYGIWPEASEQGRIAGANAAGENISYQAASPGVSFHGMNTALYAIGDNGKNNKLSYRTVETKDEAKKQYEKYYYVNRRLKGAILIGDVSKMAEVTEEIQ
ncbi:FAD-dependent oxidoreductase [Lachnoclostridium edouardi]|uniref:FAD-dependent oxidoreductase n=1 Tax=Lachnoclostridium edouardi TaxID=1926283 RepID=UPI000C79F2CD|nr:FAD-dependent oxidoreductase [Lachnoclostridium edouardi]